MKPFNLERAIAGDPVITRAGQTVKIAGSNIDADENAKIVGWINDKAYTWRASGKTPFGEREEHDHDLFMVSRTRIVWVNIYNEFGCLMCTGPFDSQQESDERHANDFRQNNYGARIQDMPFPIEIKE